MAVMAKNPYATWIVELGSPFFRDYLLHSLLLIGVDNDDTQKHPTLSIENLYDEGLHTNPATISITFSFSYVFPSFSYQYLILM